MFTTRRLSASCILLFCLLSIGLAQGEQPGKTKRTVSQSGSMVTASAAAERVRFTAPSNVVRMQLQVISEDGQVLFDVSSKGNVLDWTLQDSSGQRLQGAYLTLLTVKSLSGRLSERIGSVSIGEKQVELRRVDPAQLTAAPQQAVGPVEENGALTILQADEAAATTVLAHNGSEGQIIRDRGALSFRLGDFFRGNDQEQMRLTEEGNLGIGTNKPQARLDVAGDIRSSGFLHLDKGVEFADGTVQTTGLSGRKDKDGDLIPNASGTGTQNRIAKWTDNSGALGDSLLGEAGGGIELRPAGAGVGINPIFINPSTNAGFSQLQAYPVTGQSSNLSFAVVPRGAGAAGNRAQLAVFNTDFIADSSNYEFAALRARGSDFVFGSGKGGTGQNLPFMFASGFLSDNTTNNGQLYLAANGNVGIGNTLPGTKLDVTGNINTSTQYNIAGQRMLSNPGTNNLFAGAGAGLNTSGFGFNAFFGSSAGSANTTGNRNSFFGANAGSANTTGAFNSFFGFFAGISNTADHNSFFGSLAGANNTSGGSNSFFGDNAGSSNVTGGENSFFGASAGAANPLSNANSFFGFRAGANTTGTFASGGNSFFGSRAGEFTTTGDLNAFFGLQAGTDTTTGKLNSFFGTRAGQSNDTGDRNVAIGNDSSVGSNLSQATAIGSGAVVTQSDSLVLGRYISATNPTKVGIGVSAPLATFHVVSYSTSASNNTADFQAPNIGSNHSHIHFGTTGDWYLRSAASEGKVILQDTGGNVGIGTGSPNAKLQVSGGDVAVTTQGSGIILRATTDIGGPVCYRLTVDALGTLGTTPVVCP